MTTPPPRLPNTVPMVRAVLRGHILTQPWSCGIYADAAGAQNAASSDCTALAALLVTAATTWVTAVKANWSAATSFEAISVYAYAANTLISHANGTSSFTPVVGTGTNIQPAYVSAVHTLQTPQSGASFRGRCYVPATAQAPAATTHQWTVVQATTWANAFAAMLGSWQSVSQSTITNFIPVVFSARKGDSTGITAIKVDTMPDTQHRRENAIAITGSATHSVP